MKVLMATDGSKNAARALTTACRILSPQDREIDLLCVAPAVGPKHQAHRAKLCRRAKRILEAARVALSADGISAKPVVQTGSPARALIAASLNYDVTVVGAKSHKNRSPQGMGPVTSRVAEHSNGTVLVARELHNDAGIKILVPVDGSEGSVLALDKLAALVDLSVCRRHSGPRGGNALAARRGRSGVARVRGREGRRDRSRRRSSSASSKPRVTRFSKMPGRDCRSEPRSRH